MTILYTAVFHKENDTYWIEFPDLPGCFSDGDTVEQAMSNAKEALSIHCVSLLEDVKKLPEATPITELSAPTDGFLSLVEASITVKSRSVKKTLTIPGWLNEIAEEKGINFSAILQNALMQTLQIGN